MLEIQQHLPLFGLIGLPRVPAMATGSRGYFLEGRKVRKYLATRMSSLSSGWKAVTS